MSNGLKAFLVVALMGIVAIGGSKGQARPAIAPADMQGEI